ncbi:MAG: hypothetical protein ABSD28_06080 [Tepidisphaeraceae bacterium]|jgi:hypothetical protein
MPTKPRQAKSSSPKRSAIPDFAESDADFSEIPEFDRAMRGLIGVAKNELNAELTKERKRKKHRR